jgi:hypothetical protein
MASLCLTRSLAATALRRPTLVCASISSASSNNHYRDEGGRRGLHAIKGGPSTLSNPAVTKQLDKVLPCSMIPGDGVGPELMHSVKEVFKAGGVPVKFEELFFSELNPYLSVSTEKGEVCFSIYVGFA